MNYAYIIAIDQGTHATRAIVYDYAGIAIFHAQQTIHLTYGKAHHVEQDGGEILNSCRKVLHDSHQYIQKHRLENVAVVLTTQRSTVIGWHTETGEALSPALSWLDTRAQNELRALHLNKHAVKAKTGLQVSAHYGASKLRWLLDHHEEVRNAKQQNRLLLGPLAAFIVYNLLDGHPAYVDYANAHRTLLWNIHRLDWDEELLETFSIASKLLPLPVPNAFQYGKLLDYDYPLVLLNGDQNAAIYGHAHCQAETALVNVGTGGFVMAHSARLPDRHTSLLSSITYSSCTQKDFAIEGTINGAGAALNWAQEHWNLNHILDIDWQGVNDVPVFVNAVGGLGSPWWQSDLKPAFVDASKTFTDYSAAQCKAALMESIVFLIVNNIEAIQRQNIHMKKLLVSGGLTNDSYFCQRLADLSDLPVMVSLDKESTARGAAWLAFARPAWNVHFDESIQPQPDQALTRRYHQFTQAIMQNRFKNRLIAHRGDRANYPENSLMAVQAAVQLGFSAIEIDIQLSKDHIPMVIHDDNLLRTVGVDKTIYTLTKKELAFYQLNDPSKTNQDDTLRQIPTLSSVIKALNDHPHVTLFVEIKRQSIAHFGLETVIEAVNKDLKTAHCKIVVISFNAEVIALMQSQKSYSVGWVLREFNSSYQQQAEQMQPDFLFCEFNKIDRTKRLWQGPWQWVLYNVQDPIQAYDLLNEAGTLLVEIDDIVRFASLPR